MSVAFVDIETTGLNPARHELWEVALIVDEAEIVYRVEPDLAKAEPQALRINHFYQRTEATNPLMPVPVVWHDPEYVADIVARATAGRHLVGAAPSFDAAFLERFLRRNGLAAAWHHRLICVETYAAGRYGWPVPRSLRDTGDELGITVPDEDRHTALGDARLAKAIYEQLVGEAA